MKKIFYRTTFIPCLIILGGCASIARGPNQNFTVNTINNIESNKTSCEIRNEEGVWNAAPDVPISIHRDGNTMEINCKNTKQVGKGSVDSDFEIGYVGVNFFFFDLCTISCIFDGFNNSFFQYPSSISVQMVRN